MIKLGFVRGVAWYVLYMGGRIESLSDRPGVWSDVGGGVRPPSGRGDLGRGVDTLQFRWTVPCRPQGPDCLRSVSERRWVGLPTVTYSPQLNCFLFSLSVCPPPLSVHPSVLLSVRPSVPPSVCPSVHPSVHPFIHLSGRPPARPSVRPSVRPSARPSVRLSVRLPLSIHISHKSLNFSHYNSLFLGSYSRTIAADYSNDSLSSKSLAGAADADCSVAEGWLGATDGAVRGVFRWTDGVALRWSQWGAEFPAWNMTGAQCLYSSQGGWQDRSCNKLHSFFCQDTGQSVINPLLPPPPQ